MPCRHDKDLTDSNAVRKVLSNQVRPTLSGYTLENVILCYLLFICNEQTCFLTPYRGLLFTADKARFIRQLTHLKNAEQRALGLVDHFAIDFALAKKSILEKGEKTVSKQMRLRLTI